VFQKYGYTTLKTKIEDIYLAAKRTEYPDSTICTVFGYREINGNNDSLQTETTRLLQHLSRLHQSLQESPHLLFPSLYHESISFLGRQEQVLCDTNGRVLSCLIQPLLILHESEMPSSILPARDNLPLVLHSNLETFLSEITPPAPISPKHWLKKFKRANHYLGTILFIIPLLVGLFGILHSVGFSTLAQIIGISIMLVPVLLLLLAWSSFRDFQKQNQFKIIFKLHPSTDPTFTESFKERLFTTPITKKQTEASEWSSQVSAAFLLDALESTLGALLLTYRQENWQAYAKNLQTFLINGIRLSILQRTGSVPPENLDSLTEHLPLADFQDDLTRCINRLHSAQQTHPLTKSDAQICANFVVAFLRSINALPLTWEERLFRIIPRITVQSPIIPPQENSSKINGAEKSPEKKSSKSKNM
jgi:hypothetical protein